MLQSSIPIIIAPTRVHLVSPDPSAAPRGEEGVGTLQAGTMMSVLLNLDAGMDDDAALHAKFEEL